MFEILEEISEKNKLQISKWKKLLSKRYQL